MNKPPTMPQLYMLPTKTEGIKLHILPKIGQKYYALGTLLLNDESGAKLCAIEHEFNKNANMINYHILQQWLEGSGKTPVTWRTLIEVMKNIGLKKLAREIQSCMNEDIQENDPPKFVKRNLYCSLLYNHYYILCFLFVAFLAVLLSLSFSKHLFD